MINDVLIVCLVNGVLEVSDVCWWLILWFYQGVLKEWKVMIFNVWVEIVVSLCVYCDSFKYCCCLVVVDGWYEWSGFCDDDVKCK